MDHWNGPLEWTTGMNYWNGPLEWTTGMDHWNGLLEWTLEHEVWWLQVTYEHSEAALNQNHSVAHVITFLKFKTWMVKHCTGTCN